MNNFKFTAVGKCRAAGFADNYVACHIHINATNANTIHSDSPINVFTFSD